MTQAAVPLYAQSPLLDLLGVECGESALRHMAGGNVPEHLWERSLLGPLRDFLSRPGKEFRARLVELAWEMAGGHGQLPPRAWLTIEALHAGSLIIDDIEDESRYRRGKPALHCTYGVPVAINTGNWLYFWAEQLCSSLGLSAVSELELRRTLTRSVLGCHYGQALDLSTRVTTLAQRDVFEVVQVITRLKTGSLTELSAATGAIVAGAEPGCVRALTDFGRALGIGLQMLDDVSGIYQEARCHKGHEDLIHARATWPFAWLAESLDEVGFSRLQHRAREVEQHDVHPELVARQMRDALGSSPRERVSLYLASALNDLRKVVGDSQAFRALSHDVERLEHSYG